MDMDEAKSILKNAKDTIYTLGAKVKQLEAENQLLKTMKTGSNMGFKITQGKGFHITFDNGWTASVQWGTGNYCSNRNLNIHYTTELDKEVGATGSEDAEIAAWDKSGNWYNFGADEVKGYVTPNKVLMFLNMVAGF